MKNKAYVEGYLGPSSGLNNYLVDFKNTIFGLCRDVPAEVSTTKNIGTTMYTETPPLPSESLDLIFSNHACGHHSQKEQSSFFVNAALALEKGGKFVFGAPLSDTRFTWSALNNNVLSYFDLSSNELKDDYVFDKIMSLYTGDKSELSKTEKKLVDNLEYYFAGYTKYNLEELEDLLSDYGIEIDNVDKTKGPYGGIDAKITATKVNNNCELYL